MGVWVSQLPQPTRAAERVQEIEIPGRAGALTLKEGDNVHKAYVKECIITVPWTADFPALLDWLTGDGEIIFSTEPDRVYWAHLASEVKFDRIGNTLKQATLPFSVHPHKGQWPPESNIIINSSGTIYNPGTVASKPIITFTYKQACNLVINGEMMAFVRDGGSVDETITVDFDAHIILTATGLLWNAKAYGDWPLLQPGENTIAIQTPVVYDSSEEYNTLYQITEYTSGSEYRMRVPIGTGDHGTNNRWLTVGTLGTNSVGSEIIVKPRWRWF